MKPCRVVTFGVEGVLPTAGEVAVGPGDVWAVEPAATLEAAVEAARRECDVLVVSGGADLGERLHREDLWPATAIVVADPAATIAALAVDVEVARIRAALARLRELGGDEFVAEVTEMFLEQTPQQIAAIRASDAASAKKTAHTLKSAAANFGARAVQGLAFAIETGAGELVTLAEQLAEAYHRTEAVLRSVH